MPQRDYVNLGFFHGAAIAEGNPELEGTGKDMRHIKIQDRETARSALVERVLREAMEERAAALGLSRDERETV
jgi:hypothetical protein